MTNEQIAAVIQRVVELQLADTRQAIEAGHKPIAVKEIVDAMRVLKQLAAAVRKS